MKKSMKRSIPSSGPLCEEKRALRARKTAQLEGLDAEYIKSSDEAILNKLLSLDELKSAAVVFLYHSIGREVSTVKLIELLIESSRSIALPVSGNKGVMEFYPVNDPSQLRQGRYGIPEPPATQALRPKKDDIIIVPALCCDRSGHRLGHGAGYYDRYLAGTDCFSVCLCRRALLEDRLPVESTDIKVSMVLTD